jgi:hypothetical protein
MILNKTNVKLNFLKSTSITVLKPPSMKRKMVINQSERTSQRRKAKAPAIFGKREGLNTKRIPEYCGAAPSPNSAPQPPNSSPRRRSPPLSTRARSEEEAWLRSYLLCRRAGL